MHPCHPPTHPPTGGPQPTRSSARRHVCGEGAPSHPHTPTPTRTPKSSPPRTRTPLFPAAAVWAARAGRHRGPFVADGRPRPGRPPRAPAGVWLAAHGVCGRGRRGVQLGPRRERAAGPWRRGGRVRAQAAAGGCWWLGRLTVVAVDGWGGGRTQKGRQGKTLRGGLG